jgi:hypothetical protein
MKTLLTNEWEKLVLNRDIETLRAELAHHEMRALLPPSTCSDVLLFISIEQSRAREVREALKLKESALESILEDERREAAQLGLSL